MRRKATKTSEVIDLVDDSICKDELEIVDLTKNEPEITVLKEIKNSMFSQWSNCNNNLLNSLNVHGVNKSNDIKIANVSVDCDTANNSIYGSNFIPISGRYTPRTTQNSQKAFFIHSSASSTTGSVNDDDVTILDISSNSKKSKISRVHPKNRNVITDPNASSIHTRSAKKGKKSPCKSKKSKAKSNKKGIKLGSLLSNEEEGPLTPVSQYYENLQIAVVKNRKNKKQNSPKNKKAAKFNRAKNNNKAEIIQRKKEKIERHLRCVSLQNSVPSNQRKKRSCNLINPNPYEIDKEGLRPIVIDGSNIAIGHGRTRFSTKGIQICVDYFSHKGHTKSLIKVFLPLYRKEEFPNDTLEQLEEKCDVIFTPSMRVNGVTHTSYDDRFIVQYAVEVGGVIVSNDNYRDLLNENPLWRESIVHRHLMFTWADDVLMFPVDPYGRNGPTLDELLRF